MRSIVALHPTTLPETRFEDAVHDTPLYKAQACLFNPESAHTMTHESQITNEAAKELLARVHALRDVEESERARFLGSMIGHDLNNALFALVGRLQLLKRKVSDPALIRSVDELQATAQVFEKQIALLHDASPRDPRGVDNMLARAAVTSELEHAQRLIGISFEGVEHALTTIPSDATIIGDTHGVAVAIRQLIALHRHRNAHAIRVSSAIVSIAHGTPLSGATPSQVAVDATWLELSFADDAGAWPLPCAVPSLLSGAFDFALTPLGAAHRAIRDFGGKIELRPSASGLCSVLSFELRRGIPLAHTTTVSDSNDACAHEMDCASPPRCVLIADDDPAVRAVLVAALESIGDDVDTTDVPGSIGQRVDLEHFDVIVLDAGGGGLEALRTLRAAGLQVPVLLASGHLLDHVASEFGPTTRTILKPFGLDILDRELTILSRLRT